MKVNKTKVKEFWKKNGKVIAIGVGGGLSAVFGFYVGHKCTVNALANDITKNPKFRDVNTCFMLRDASNYVVESIRGTQDNTIDCLKDMYDIALQNGFNEDSTINGVLIYGSKK